MTETYIVCPNCWEAEKFVDVRYYALYKVADLYFAAYSDKDVDEPIRSKLVGTVHDGEEYRCLIYDYTPDDLTVSVENGKIVHISRYWKEHEDKLDKLYSVLREKGIIKYTDAKITDWL